MRAVSNAFSRLAVSLAPTFSILSTSTTTSTTAKTRRQRLTSSSSPGFFVSAAAAASSPSSPEASASREAAAASASNINTGSFSFVAASERGTSLLASLLSRGRRPGDVFLLYGDVGAGKSAFARAFIRAAALDDDLPVPSPTFLLHNVYDDDVVADGGPAIHHFDLYRLGGEGGVRVSLDSRKGKESSAAASSSPSSSSSLSAIDAERCGLADALSLSSGEESGVSLVEWADRLGGASSSSNPASPSPSSPPTSSTTPWSFRLEGEQRVLEVAIEPLSSEEVSSPGVAERHPLFADSKSRPAADDAEEVEDDDEFADTRWRRITLRPRGARALEAAEDASRALREIVGGEVASIERDE